VRQDANVYADWKWGAEEAGGQGIQMAAEIMKKDQWGSFCSASNGVVRYELNALMVFRNRYRLIPGRTN